MAIGDVPPEFLARFGDTLIWSRGSADGATADDVADEFAKSINNKEYYMGITPIIGGRFRILGAIEQYTIRLEPGGVWAIYRDMDDSESCPYPKD